MMRAFRKSAYVLLAALMALSICPSTAIASHEAVGACLSAAGQESASERAAVAEHEATAGLSTTSGHEAAKGQANESQAQAETDDALIIQASDDELLEATPSSDETTVSINATGGRFSRSRDVRFAVWSTAGGQDDLRWYGTERISDGWSHTVKVHDHKSSGKHIVHAYACDSGTPCFLGETTFSITPTKAKASFSQTDEQIARGVFQISVKIEECPSGVNEMLAPTWSLENGQDDIVWYRMQEPSLLDAMSIERSDGSLPEEVLAAMSDGSGKDWVAEIPCASSIREPGEFAIHIYVRTNNGIFSGVATTKGNAQLGPSHIEASTADDELTYTIKAYGGDFARADSLLLPTWSARKGQDDIVWYKATKESAEWRLSVPIRNHRTAGTYHCHAYASNGSQLTFIGETWFTVTEPSAEARIVDSGNGFYTVETIPSDSPSGIASVTVPTWTESRDQDDLIWHDSERQGEAKWSCRIEAGRHGGQDGKYISHVYVTSGNGIQVMVKALSIEVSCSDYVFVTGEEGTGYRRAWLKNPTTSGPVRMPTWSVEAGQDDIVWYDTSPGGDNRWVAKIDCGRLKHPGTIVTHVYIGDRFAGQTTFSIAEADLAKFRGVGPLSDIIGSSTDGFGAFGIDYDMRSPNGLWLQSAIGSITSGGHSLSMLMIDLKTGRGVSYNSGQQIYSASSIKGPYVAAINRFYPTTVSSGVASTMHSTITVSSNEGYSALRNQYGAGPMANLQNAVNAHGFPAGRNYVDISAKDLAKLWVGCYDYFYESKNERSDWCRSLYANPYLSFIHSALGSKYMTYTKPGWIGYGGRYNARNDAGIVIAGDRPYVIAVLSSAYGRDSALSNLVMAIDAVHSDMVR